MFSACQDNQNKKVKYFLKNHLTLRNLFSIIVKQIALSSLQTTEYPSCVTVMAYPLGQIGMRSGSSPTLNNRITKNRVKKGGDLMESTSFMRVDEVAQELGISKSYAYKIVQKLNAELKEKGFMTISGRVNKQYFMERTCYGATKKERD